jgi:hypothetical protein
MKITFSSLGFRSTDVFITNISDKYPGQYHIGFVTKLFTDNFDFDYFGIYLDELKDIIPTPEQIIEEYKRQLTSKSVCINPDGIVYAG